MNPSNISTVVTAQTLGAAAWFKLPKPNPKARVRLFCFPYAGGGSSIFRAWPEQLSSDIEVVQALLPGRESRLREPALTSLEEIIDAAAQAIQPLLDRPFALFGHSMGGIISFELARRLRWEHGVEPVQLFISGRRAPQLPERDPRAHDLPEHEFLAEVARLNGTPKEVLEHAELLELVVPLLRADFAVCHNYTYLPAPPLKCPITVFGGLRDEETSREKLEAWSVQTRAACTLHMLPGDHFFINREYQSMLRIVEQKLQTVLRQGL